LELRDHPELQAPLEHQERQEHQANKEVRDFQVQLVVKVIVGLLEVLAIQEIMD